MSISIETKAYALLSGIPDLSDNELTELFMFMAKGRRGFPFCGIVPFDMIAGFLEDEDKDAIDEFIASGRLNLQEIYVWEFRSHVRDEFELFMERDR